MIDSFIQFFEALVRVSNETPVQIWALVCGMLISWGITQRIKFMFTDTINPALKRLVTQSVAFSLACAATYLLWPSKEGLVAGIVNGLWAPVSYWCAVKILRWKFPKTADALSQDKSVWDLE